MKRPLDRVFYYHAAASPIGGHITHPVEAVLDQQASVTLPQAGGKADARVANYNLNNMIQCEAAYSHTAGSIQKSTGNWTTLVTSVVEGVNIFDIVTVDRMVSTIALEHPRKGYYPKVSFLGSQMENLRIGGRGIKTVLHPQALAPAPRFPAPEPTSEREAIADPRRIEFPDSTWTAQPAITNWARSQRDTILGTDAPQEIKDRFSWVADPQQIQQRGYVLCSLFDKVEGAAPGTDYGHVINVPDLGYLFLGELIVDHLSFKLSMIRLEFGCAVDGNMSMCDSGGGGVTMP